MDERTQNKALALFRILHGPGDGGGKVAFHCINPSVQQGWFRLAKRFLALERRAASDLINNQERTCVYCGCTDGNACPGGCAWLEKHKATPTGVCSSCAPKLLKAADRL